MIYINIITIEKKILIGSYHGDNDQIWSWWLGLGGLCAATLLGI
ncbi:hypothetical protein AO385_0312 [Moraxella catarrhalis]|nr:hypothetical protein AO383_0248 [Moraxella catarrhalis]OAV03926.1 hypothetical protein AO385_0312 [Moraxella catarrhalis]